MPKKISLRELDTVLERARSEHWRDLVLLGPDNTYPRESFGSHWFQLAAPIGTRIAAIANLSELSSLVLHGNAVGDSDARKLAKLGTLKTLRISSNEVGDSGATALSDLTQLTSLDLSGNRIGPRGTKALANLKKLISLDLSDNEIGPAGAAELARLTRLRSLDLARCKLGADAIKEFKTLRRLQSLDLIGNNIGDAGAQALTVLSQLSSLFLWRNKIGDEGAVALSTIVNLNSLFAWGNSIGDVGARALATLPRLAHLDLNTNRIGDDGARALAACTQLIDLDLGGNQIGDDGIRALATLAGLRALDLSKNKIGPFGASFLLDQWCKAPTQTRAEDLHLDDNRDLSSLVPKEILDSGDAQAILAAYRRYRDAAGTRALGALNEAKMLVVGNEAVGKTSLIRYLVRGEARDPDERKTPGTAIHEQIAVSEWSEHQTAVRLNVWDFGGQEIMRGTHRFFLTERSLYLLVVEDRREDDRSIYEWLQIISQHGGDSPVIVVINKCDNEVPQRHFDEVGLQRDYPSIVGFVRTSCNADARSHSAITALRVHIATTISRSPRLKHVHDPIPSSWLRVKEVLSQLASRHSVLPVRDFERLCDDSVNAAERVSSADEQRALLGLLHDLGVVIAHGLRRDASAARREVTVLDPNWLTGAIYSLINSQLVRDQSGELRQDQMSEILDGVRYPALWHELIISMMQEPELGLCLPIEGGGTPRYLLPDALPVNEPDVGSWPDDALRFRFRYGLLPTGFIPRVIVEGHRCLTDQSVRWRTGVVFYAEGCRILVRSDTARNRVELHVDGQTRRRSALSIVRSYLEAVHSRYAKPDSKARVPLPGNHEVDVGYEHLAKLEARYGLDYTFLPEDGDREYSVAELLEGVRDDGSRRRRVRDDGIDGAPVYRRHDRHNERRGQTVDRPSQVFRCPHFGKIDFGVITIREDENTAVLKRSEHVAKEEGRRRYRIRQLPLAGGGAYKLAIVRCTEQGNTDAQGAARDLLEDLAPRFLLVVGIAGGAPSNEFTLGDVVVSTRIVDFSVEAVIRGKDREYALGGGPLDPAAAKLAADISAMVADGELAGWNTSEAVKHVRPPVVLSDDRFYGDDEWMAETKKKVRRHFATRKPRPPIVTTGAIASSDRLLKDDEIMAVWLKFARQVIAVEMESAGIYKAAHGRVPFLAIRGISDVVGFRRDADWTTYACETAAAFMRAFLLSRPLAALDGDRPADSRD